MADLNTSIGMYNYKKYLSSSNSDISELIKSHGIVNRHNMNWYQRFNRFGFIDPFNTMTTTKEYIFFTKPDLNIFNGTQLNPELEQRSLFFREMYKTHNHLLSQWQSSYGSSNNPFIALLSNAVSSELDLPTLSANTVETAETAYGYHMTYRGTTYGSDKDVEFTLQFDDTRELEVYKFFRIYDEYEEMKSMGLITPKIEYILNRVIHDQMTVYKIVVAEDGMTILYYARITGVFPLGANRDAFSSMNNNDGQKISISFHGHKVKDMDPRIIGSFNKIVSPYINGKNDLPLYNSTNKHVDGSWSACPYIGVNNNAKGTKGQMNKYYLLWKK